MKTFCIKATIDLLVLANTYEEAVEQASQELERGEVNYDKFDYSLQSEA
jgi:hypothetical protein